MTHRCKIARLLRHTALAGVLGRRGPTVRVAWERARPLQAKTTAERSSPTRGCRTSCRTGGRAKRSGRSQSGRRPLLDPFGSEDMSRASCASALLGPLSTSRVTSGHAGLEARAACQPSATQPEMPRWASPVQLLCGHSAGWTSWALVRGEVVSAFAPRCAPPRCTRLQHAAAHSWPLLGFAALRAATLVHYRPYLGCAVHVLRALSRHACALAPPWPGSFWGGRCEQEPRNILISRSLSITPIHTRQTSARCHCRFLAHIIARVLPRAPSFVK